MYILGYWERARIWERGGVEAGNGQAKGDGNMKERRERGGGSAHFYGACRCLWLCVVVMPWAFP